MTGTPYDRLAAAYDGLAALYSLGAIRRVKLVHTELLQPGERVLYAGVGSGQELTRALARGAVPTVVDTSGKMLDRARRRLGRAAGRVTFQQRDPADLLGLPCFDHVVASFFLNVFAEQDVQHRLDALAALTRPGGNLTIADFCGPSPGWFSSLQRAYYLPPLWLFHWLTANPLHPLPDYRELARTCQIKLVEVHQVTKRTLGLPFYESITFRVGGRAPSPALWSTESDSASGSPCA